MSVIMGFGSAAFANLNVRGAALVGSNALKVGAVLSAGLAGWLAGDAVKYFDSATGNYVDYAATSVFYPVFKRLKGAPSSQEVTCEEARSRAIYTLGQMRLAKFGDENGVKPSDQAKVVTVRCPEDPAQTSDRVGAKPLSREPQPGTDGPSEGARGDGASGAKGAR